MPDFAIDYGLLHEAKKDLNDLADRIGPKLKDSAFAQVYRDADGDTVFGDAGLASSFDGFYTKVEYPMGQAEKRLRELGDIFGAVADGYFDVDAQIAEGAGVMASQETLDDWKSRKGAWDYRQAHLSECTPGPDGKMPAFCSATDPGPAPTDITTTTPNGSVHTHVTLDDKNNVVKEETTVTHGDQTYKSTTTYSADRRTQTTDTTFGDGSKTHSVTNLTDTNGSSVTDTTDQSGKKTHTVVALNPKGGGTMKVTDPDGLIIEYTRPDRGSRWTMTRNPEDAYYPAGYA